MKITHIALCGPVTDGWTYQDNLLPKYHKKLGYDVSLITSKYIYNEKGDLKIDKRNEYINENDIRVIRLENRFRTNINSKFKTYKNLFNKLLIEKPDIIFVHGLQFLDIKEIIRYKKNNKMVKIYVDNHADFSNSATNWISKNILHKIIWRYYAQLISPYVEKFYGVLPARVDFLKNIYDLPEEKVELLVMGVDDDKVKAAEKCNIKIREKYGIKSDDFLIITGGKINNSKKQTLLLMDAVQKINKKNLKLIIFGSIIEELQDKFNKLLDNNRVKYVGWLDADEIYNYFATSDLAVFPGRHSVLWEQVAGMGIPLLVKYWPGTTHIDVDGNCEFLYEDSIDEIKSKLKLIMNNKKYNEMKIIAENEGKKNFLYSNIAKKSLDL
jgi:hypothetical protein